MRAPQNATIIPRIIDNSGNARLTDGSFVQNQGADGRTREFGGNERNRESLLSPIETIVPPAGNPPPSSPRSELSREAPRFPSDNAHRRASIFTRYPRDGAKKSRPWLNAVVSVLFLLSSGVALVNL